MDDKAFHVRIPKKWVRVALIITTTALIVAPLTAIASHSFTDVPDSNTFHADIAWLADAGVTKGCNPPANTEFCPNDNVSRGQMSAFMRRFSQYIDAEDGTPAQADNATTADHATTADSAATADDATKLGGDSKSTFQQWGATLPPDQSLTGVFAVNGDNGFPTDNITFSPPLPGDIPGSDTHFLAVGDPTTADCPGPGEAAPGNLCVYEVENSANITFWCFCDPEQGISDQAQSYGTALFMLATDNDQWSYGSWTVMSASGLGELSVKTQSEGDPDSPG